MNKYRWAEALNGLIATFLALVSLAYLLFGPVYSVTTSTGTNGTASILDAHIQPTAIIAFGLFLAAIIGVGVSAVLHSRTQKMHWHTILLCSVIVMILFTLITLLSVGPFVAPSALFAILALYLSYTNGTVKTQEGNT